MFVKLTLQGDPDERLAAYFAFFDEALAAIEQIARDRYLDASCGESIDVWFGEGRLGRTSGATDSQRRRGGRWAGYASRFSAPELRGTGRGRHVRGRFGTANSGPRSRRSW
jgi:hypothetical protein